MLTRAVEDTPETFKKILDIALKWFGWYPEMRDWAVRAIPDAVKREIEALFPEYHARFWPITVYGKGYEAVQMSLFGVETAPEPAGYGGASADRADPRQYRSTDVSLPIPRLSRPEPKRSDSGASRNGGSCPMSSRKPMTGVLQRGLSCPEKPTISMIRSPVLVVCLS